MRVPGPDELGRRLHGSSGALRGTGASEEVLAEAEKELGGQLPTGYRRYLQEFGWGSAGEVQVLGLGPDVPAAYDLLGVRRSLGDALPPDFVPVARDASGVLLLNLAHEGPYDSPVYRLADPPEYLAHDFSSWLWTVLDRAGTE